MADMTVREKAIKHFQGLQKRYEKSHNMVQCEHIKLAIAALQAQTPRVVAFNEIKSNLPRHLWIECNEPETLYLAIARECITIDGNDWMMFSEDGFGGDYGVGKLYCKTWRCWTHKPTAEQMAATPWGKEGEE